MKILIISDIHGSLKDMKKMIDLEKIENFDHIIILGDILHYCMYDESPQSTEVALLLNQLKTKIIAVRGNCDTESDLDQLDFEVSVNKVIKIDGYTWHLMHGNNMEKDLFLNNDVDKLLLTGHTHISCLSENNINPGSISKPRGRSTNSYIIYENKKFSLYDLNTHQLINQLKLK